nr:MAG: RNA-dependent RNA polymerase [Riboviria sp.]
MLSRKARISRPLCICSKTSKLLLVQEVPIAYQHKFYNSCICNEYHALLRRHLVQRPDLMDVRYFQKQVRNYILEFIPKGPIVRVSFEHLVSRYTGAKRRLYQKAAELLDFDRNERSWSVVSMFVKAERIPTSDLDSKAPRAIQFRKPQFNLLLASYLHPLELAAYQMTGVIGLRMVAKGLNNLQRASLLVEASNSFRDPLYIMLDHSKFDSYVNKFHLKYCHIIYNKVFSDPYLRYLLHFQVNNRGWTKGGIRYSVEATRMSGDFDTGMGNTLINLLVIRAWFNNFKHYMLVDGDDAVLIVEKLDAQYLDSKHFSRMGFETQLSYTTELEGVEFCRAKLLLLDPPRFAREPWRALSHLSSSLKSYSGSGIPRYLAGIGLGELAASNGVPIIMPIALKMSTLSKKPIYDEGYIVRYGDAGKLAPITSAARIAYWLAWGITPTEQERIEAEYTPNWHAGLHEWFNSLPENAEITQ